MLQYNPTVSGSLTITGSLTVTNGVIGTVSGVDIQIFSSSINQVITGIQGSTGSSDEKFNTLSSVTSSALTRLTNIESKSASVDISISNINSVTASNIARLSNLETKSSSVDISISSINTFTSSNANTSLNSYTGSNDTKFTTLGTYTGSLDTKNTTLSSVTSSLISKTGSYATTGSNTFVGTTIMSGSTYVQGDLIVFGSSSIQYISASSVSIGTNIVQLNTSQPAVRFGGLSVQDSGSAAGVTGSMFWDGCCNRWIYSNPSGVGYSGGVLMSGPRGSTLGNEPTLTCNYIAKSGGGDHLYDSCIIDDGTTTCIKNNLIGTGTACFAGAVCTPTIQSANVCTDGSYGSRVVAYGSNVGMFVNSTGAGEGYYRILNGACSIGALAATGWYKGSGEQNMGIITGPSKSFQIATNDCANARLTIGADGISVFACQVCIPTLVVTNCINVGTISSLGSMLSIQSPNDQAGITMYNTYDCNKWSLRTGTVGVSNKGFAIVDDICNITRIQINGAGYVGIGTCTPATQLEIKGTNTYHKVATCFFSTYNAGFAFSDYLAGITYEAGSNTLCLYSNYATYGGIVLSTATVPRLVVSNNGATRTIMNGISTAVLQQSYNTGLGGCINVCFDIYNAIPGKGNGYIFQADIYVSGYGSAGSSGLVYRASVGGYDGHYVGVGGYHQYSEQVKCAMGVAIALYNPSGSPCLLGVTIYNCNGSYTHTGTMRMVITY